MNHQSQLDRFTLEVLRSALAQVCEEAGFAGSSGPGFACLQDICGRYIEEIGYRAKMYTEASGRNESNVYDVLAVFNELNVDLPTLIRYGTTTEVGTSRPIPKFPVQRPSIIPSAASQNISMPEHVPPEYPAFPRNHTYSFTPKDIPIEDPRVRSERAAKQKVEAEQSLERLNEKFPLSTPMSMFAASPSASASMTPVASTPIRLSSLGSAPDNPFVRTATAPSSSMMTPALAASRPSLTLRAPMSPFAAAATPSSANPTSTSSSTTTNVLQSPPQGRLGGLGSSLVLRAPIPSSQPTAERSLTTATTSSNSVKVDPEKSTTITTIKVKLDSGLQRPATTAKELGSDVTLSSDPNSSNVGVEPPTPMIPDRNRLKF